MSIIRIVESADVPDYRSKSNLLVFPLTLQLFAYTDPSISKKVRNLIIKYLYLTKLKIFSYIKDLLLSFIF